MAKKVGDAVILIMPLPKLPNVVSTPSSSLLFRSKRVVLGVKVADGTTYLLLESPYGTKGKHWYPEELTK